MVNTGVTRMYSCVSNVLDKENISAEIFYRSLYLSICWFVNLDFFMTKGKLIVEKKQYFTQIKYTCASMLFMHCISFTVPQIGYGWTPPIASAISAN